MKKIFLMLLLAHGIISAHEFVILPVNIELRVKQSGVHATFVMDADYMWEAVLAVPFGKTLPGTEWPEDIRQKAIAYLDKSFALSVSSIPLVSTKHVCRYIEEPYTKSKTRFYFEAFYPIPEELLPLSGKSLNGKATFFSEYSAEAHHEGAEEETIPAEFVSHLNVISDNPLKFDVPLESPEFIIPIEKHMYSRSLERKETIKLVTKMVMTSRPFVFGILALVLLFWRHLFRPSNPALPDVTKKYRLAGALLLLIFSAVETIINLMRTIR